MDSDGLGESHQPEKRGAEPIVSIIENSEPVSMSQKMDEGQQEGDQEILLTFMGLQLVSKQSMETVELFLLLFLFRFVSFRFVVPSPTFIKEKRGFLVCFWQSVNLLG